MCLFRLTRDSVSWYVKKTTESLWLSIFFWKFCEFFLEISDFFGFYWMIISFMGCSRKSWPNRMFKPDFIIDRNFQLFSVFLKKKSEPSETAIEKKCFLDQNFIVRLLKIVSYYWRTLGAYFTKIFPLSHFWKVFLAT